MASGYNFQNTDEKFLSSLQCPKCFKYGMGYLGHGLDIYGGTNYYVCMTCGAKFNIEEKVYTVNSKPITKPNKKKKNKKKRHKKRKRK